MDFSPIIQKIKELLGKISNYAKKRVALRKMKKNLPPPTQEKSKKPKEEFEDDEDSGDEKYDEEFDDENDDYSQMEGEDE